MNTRIQIVYAICALCALVSIGGALPGCVVDDESPCLPAGLVKHGCNDPVAAPSCPAGQVCRAAWTCVPVGCVETGPCAARRDTARLSFYAGTDDYASEHAFTAKAAYLTNGNTRSLQLHDESTADGVTYGVGWTLPPGSSVPIAEGDTVKVEGCRAGMGPNPRWVVVLRDAADKLLLAGGEGMFVADSPCLQRLLTIRRRELGCHLYADTAMDKFSPPYMENYALELVDDLQTHVLGMNDQASLTLAGQKLTAIVIDARYPTEWAATDVNAPWDGLVIVPEKAPMTLTYRSLPILLSSALLTLGACSPRDPAGLPQRDATARRDTKVHDASIVLKDGPRRIDIDKARDLTPAPDRYDPDLGYCSFGGPACYDALKHALLLCHCQDGKPLAHCFACAKKHATPAMIQLLSQAETCFPSVCSECNVQTMKDIFYCAGGCPAAQACLADH